MTGEKDKSSLSKETVMSKIRNTLKNHRGR